MSEVRVHRSKMAFLFLKKISHQNYIQKFTRQTRLNWANALNGAFLHAFFNAHDNAEWLNKT